MAKLDKPFSIEQVKMFARVVDFYYWKGLPVARAWPRRPRQPNTAAQVATRQHFAAAGAWMKNLPASVVQRWESQNFPKGRTAKSYLRGIALRLSNAGNLNPVPSFYEPYNYPWTSQEMQLILFPYDPQFPVPGNDVAFWYAPASEDPPSLPWHKANENVQKRCRSVGRYDLNFEGFTKRSYFAWNAISDEYALTIPASINPWQILVTPANAVDLRQSFLPPFHGKNPYV